MTRALLLAVLVPVAAYAGLVALFLCDGYREAAADRAALLRELADRGLHG